MAQCCTPFSPPVTQRQALPKPLASIPGNTHRLGTLSRQKQKLVLLGGQEPPGHRQQAAARCCVRGAGADEGTTGG